MTDIAYSVAFLLFHKISQKVKISHVLSESITFVDEVRILQNVRKNT